MTAQGILGLHCPVPTDVCKVLTGKQHLYTDVVYGLVHAVRGGVHCPPIYLAHTHILFYSTCIIRTNYGTMVAYIYL